MAKESDARTLIFAAIFFIAAPSAAAAAPPELSLTLAQAESEALSHSPALKAAQSGLAAATAQVDAQFALLVPQISLQAAYQYQTIVPRLSLAPGLSSFQFGSHDSYSVGPTVSYTLWDQGTLLNAWRSQKALASSQEAQRDLVRRQVLLMTRLDYFQVQLALEQERSLADSLKLAQAQDQDIESRFRAGAASRIDSLTAQEQVVERLRDFRAAQVQASAALRTLFAQTGRNQELDASAPLDARIANSSPPEISPPTLVVNLEPLGSVEAAFKLAAEAPMDEAYPGLAVYARQARAQTLASRSLSDQLWPRFALLYKSDYMYPNMPLLESVWQNTAGVSASVPLFEFGRTRRLAAAQKDLAAASLAQEAAAYDDLARDWRKAKDEYAALSDIETLDRESVKDTSQIAELRYSSYKSGGSTILDVETADLNALQAQIGSAQTKTQELIQLATLASLSSAKETP